MNDIEVSLRLPEGVSWFAASALSAGFVALLLLALWQRRRARALVGTLDAYRPGGASLPDHGPVLLAGIIASNEARAVITQRVDLDYSSLRANKMNPMSGFLERARTLVEARPFGLVLPSGERVEVHADRESRVRGVPFYAAGPLGHWEEVTRSSSSASYRVTVWLAPGDRVHVAGEIAPRPATPDAPAARVVAATPQRPLVVDFADPVAHPRSTVVNAGLIAALAVACFVLAQLIFGPFYAISLTGRVYRARVQNVDASKHAKNSGYDYTARLAYRDRAGREHVVRDDTTEELFHACCHGVWAKVIVRDGPLGGDAEIGHAGLPSGAVIVPCLLALALAAGLSINQARLRKAPTLW